MEFAAYVYLAAIRKSPRCAAIILDRMNRIFRIRITGFFRSPFVHFVNSVQKMKTMRGKRMAETPVRLGLLAPFGGITRIRFKGFRLGRLSLAAPPLS